MKKPLNLIVPVLAAWLLTGCQNKETPTTAVSIHDAPAVRLSYRYEPDVPTPTLDAVRPTEDRNPAVQADFDASRPQEVLDRTITSLDKRHIVAVYHGLSDISSEYRLDMYTSDGKLLHKMTADNMAAHFPDTINWSPDSSSVAFVAMLRVNPAPGFAIPAPSPAAPDLGATDANDNTAVTPPPAAAPTPAAPTGILTFRSEQIYIAGADGTGVKPVTTNEGIIYFYYAWSPDSSMIAALATTVREWKYLEIVANGKGEQMVPQGRPRIVEKNGRERRLDDNLTTVRPVWAPDSTKVAAAFGNQIRVYDAAGTTPTQAAIPLRNQLLISSQRYDQEQHRLSESGNATEGQVPATPAPSEQLSTLPNEKDLASYNPIVQLAWSTDDILYLQTAYVKRMRNEADSVISFARWHRLILTVQAPATPK